MNSAAVIGRQLRQHQNTGRVSGPLVPPTPCGRNRPRTPSHNPLYPPPVSGHHSGSLLNLGGHKDAGGTEDQKKPSGLELVRSKVSLGCIWNVCKALSGGMVLIMIGTAMSVIGFYADDFSRHEYKDGNKTIEVMNEDRKYHLHNLTYVGPVMLGLGGFALVAACVLTCEKHESAGAKVVPVSSEAELITDKMTDGMMVGLIGREKLNGPNPGSLYLKVPQLSPILHRRGSSEISSSKDEEDSMSETITIQLIPNGPSKPTLADLPLFTSPPAVATTSSTGKSVTNGSLLSPQIDEYIPSPQDYEISDPDGCSTPRRASMTSMDMELYFSNCPITVRVQVEPKHFASMESDGLSDSDTSDRDPCRDPNGPFGSISLDRDLDDVDLELPLLGRCSPPLPYPHHSRTCMETPLLKRDSNPNRRFPLHRQSALENHKNVDVGLTNQT